jgi:hypothetical protein
MVPVDICSPPKALSTSYLLERRMKAADIFMNFGGTVMAGITTI